MQLTSTSRQHLKDRLVVASVSGGKDSTALALMLRELEIPHVRVFADTGFEAPETYAYRRFVIYTSLRTAGRQQTVKIRGRSWSCASRPRAGRASPDQRRWEAPSPAHATHPALVEHPQEVVHVAA